MTSLREMIRRMFTPSTPLPPGLYHYQAPPTEAHNYRLHLRLEEDGRGMLIVNASTVLQLNQTAAEYAYHLVQQTPDETAARKVANRYRISPQDALRDYREFKERVELLTTTTDLDPEFNLGFDSSREYEQPLSAPLRLDCAVTYRLQVGSDPELAPRIRAARELDTEEWKAILTSAWQAGVPHVIFTGGEATLRADLAELIRCAEANGQVTGLLSDGLKLADAAYFNELLQSGLDHLLFLLQPEREESWQALQTVLAADLAVTVHLTLTESRQANEQTWVERLAQMGARKLSLSASSSSLQERMVHLRDMAAALDLVPVWNLPVPYSAWNPVALEDPAAQAESAASLYVEPDGDVLAYQGAAQVLGNLLADSWAVVWKKAQPVEVV